MYRFRLFIEVHKSIFHTHEIVQVFKDSRRHENSSIFLISVYYGNCFLSRDPFFWSMNDVRCLDYFLPLAICTNSKEILRVFHPALHKLMEYDSENQTDLSDTLYAYLQCGKSQTETAKKLNLHRSSLQYRLKKIEEILEIGLDDCQTLFHIQICFEMQKYLSMNTA